MIQIAIDGPAGAGKSTAAKELARQLHINYMDTGAMYRAMAYALMQRGVDIADHTAVEKELDSIDIAVQYGEQGQRVLANGTDVTDFIRTPEVSKGASDVAVIPAVRLKLVKTQQETAEKYDIVMDGRDIGTYVLPDAKVKFFITASSAERAKRRYLEWKAAGIQKDIRELEQEIISRDKTDSEREFAPLRQAEDAILLDTTDMGIEDVLQAVIRQVREVYGDVL